VTDVRIAGLDLSLSSTGVALIQPGGPFSAHRIRTSVKQSTHERLKVLYTGIRPLVLGATHITVEGPSYGSNQGQHKLGGVWWIVMHILWLDNPDAEVVVVAPPTLKVYATGKGSGLEKDESTLMVAKRYGDVVDIGNNDMADAWTAAAMTADQLGFPVVEVPQTHRRALKDWPYAK
jgi:Holliday junction resolvasome RuvABC endonuclease subunit